MVIFEVVYGSNDSLGPTGWTRLLAWQVSGKFRPNNFVLRFFAAALLGPGPGLRSSSLVAAARATLPQRHKLRLMDTVNWTR